MESPKYLIIITLIDGQNFTVPEGAPDKLDASVFAEARFGNESVLKSDLIKLTNSNPEFVTELAWQLDRKILHQLRVERRAIKLQVFLQTREKKKTVKSSKRASVDDRSQVNDAQSDDSNAAHKVELIGYTILDIRSAQDRKQPKFHWLPLLNPKFRKSSYNRPEVQLAVTLSRLDDPSETKGAPNIPIDPPNSKLHSDSEVYTNENDESGGSAENGSNDSKMYKTCLDITYDSSQTFAKDGILDNDINIMSKDGIFYIYDTRSKNKPTLEDCDERYRIIIKIPFNSELNSLSKQADREELYYFSISLFQTSARTEMFKDLTSVETKEVQFNLLATDAEVLSTYFEIYSTLVIKLHIESGETIGMTTIQLDQLCRSDRKRRSIEGIFAMQSVFEAETSSFHPSIGVSVTLEKLEEMNNKPLLNNKVAFQLEPEAEERFEEDIDDFLFNSTFNDTHQLTLDETKLEDCSTISDNLVHEVGFKHDNDRHFCFTIDLKNFSYTRAQRLIPTLRELVVRYSYPFFGYKDTITTDSSIPISPTSSIIVSGFCEFNFATTIESLLKALQEIPLKLEVLTCDHAKVVDTKFEHEERLVAICNINLAEVLDFNDETCKDLKEKGLSCKFSAPIEAVTGQEVGFMEMYLCLKDLGKPTYNLRTAEEVVQNTDLVDQEKSKAPTPTPPVDSELLQLFIKEAKESLEVWKQDFKEKFEEEQRRRETERYKRLYQRFEAKDAKRDQEFRKKMEELESLEKQLRDSFSKSDSLNQIAGTYEQLKNKHQLLDSRVESLDLKISKALPILQSRLEKKIDSISVTSSVRQASSNTDIKSSKVASRNVSEMTQSRRSSLRTTAPHGIPVPVRSSSLVRSVVDSNSTKMVVGRPKNIMTTVVNGMSKPRSNSIRLNLSKETQEKLASLRREKVELLKHGCRPNDELIQEINSMIEKLAY